MKILYSHLVNLIEGNPSIGSISENLLQLGHEHSISNETFDIEFTPNRGDCLSLMGLSRDLNTKFTCKPIEVYEEKIKEFNLNFKNNDTSACPKISFLKLKIKKIPKVYESYLDNYFIDNNINKNNFFTDISNYLAYEIGQPTHCYDSKKIDYADGITFLKNKSNKSFETLMNSILEIQKDTYVFEQNGIIINVAGIMGGSNTSCCESTTECLIECAYFNPEAIIGKSIKYDIKSDASYKFERGVDPMIQEKALRRFIKIVSDHTEIEDMSVSFFNYKEFKPIHIKNNIKKINKILGVKLKDEVVEDNLKKLGFKVGKIITVPSYRSDITNQNDIAEEIGRCIGYENLPSKDFNINLGNNSKNNSKQNIIRALLAQNGFNEVINNPFVKNEECLNNIVIDNPLDSNRSALRTNLKNSLIDNLIYNENRQNDSVKIFEFSKIYNINKEEVNEKNLLGILVSGRKGYNYKEFSKLLNADSIKDIFNLKGNSLDIQVDQIERKGLDTKKNAPIYYAEVNLNDFSPVFENLNYKSNSFNDVIKYKKISQFPSTSRDLSFLVTKKHSSHLLEKLILQYEHNYLKKVFIFDFYYNSDNNKIKIGFRFTFQANSKTLMDEEVNNIINDIVKISKEIEGVSVPGLP